MAELGWILDFAREVRNLPQHLGEAPWELLHPQHHHYCINPSWMSRETSA